MGEAIQSSVGNTYVCAIYCIWRTRAELYITFLQGGGNQDETCLTWLAAIKEQNTQLVTGRGSPTAYSPTNSGEETRQTTVVPTTTGSWEETSGSEGKQQMVLSKTKQLKPEGAFGDSSELAVVQSPLATLLVTGEEEKAELVTGRQRGRAP